MRLRVVTLTLGLLAALFATVSLIAQTAPPQQTGTVTGSVRTSNGLPVAGLRVTAVSAETTDSPVRAMSGLALTDETGRFRLENVPAGRHYIAVGRVDLPTYYPGTTEMSKATPITLSSGTTTSDIHVVVDDINGVLPPTRGGRGGRGRGIQVAPITPPVDGLSPFSPQSPTPGARGRGGRGTPTAADRLTGLEAANASSAAAWWTNQALVARLGLTEDQKRKIETIFEQYRQTLVQNKALLEREESTLARMLEAEPMESMKAVTSQIDRVVQSRGEMERTNSKMTLDMRQVLTRSQWIQLQAETSQTTPARGGPAIQTRGRGGFEVFPATPRVPVPPPAPQPR